METKPCNRTDAHYPHGWVEPVDLAAGVGVPPFLECPGKVNPPQLVGGAWIAKDAYEEALERHEAASQRSRLNAGVIFGEPERANREGDTQALPVPNDAVDTQTVAIKLIEQRRELGIRRYSVALQPNNGRDSMWDLVEELLDALMYALNHWRETHPGENLPGQDF